MSDPAHARWLVAELADDRRARGHHISPTTQAEQAAARHAIAAGHLGYTAHLSRAAFDVVTVPPRRSPRSRPWPRRWRQRQPVDR